VYLLLCCVSMGQFLSSIFKANQNQSPYTNHSRPRRNRIVHIKCDSNSFFISKTFGQKTRFQNEMKVRSFFPSESVLFPPIVAIHPMTYTILYRVDSIDLLEWTHRYPNASRDIKFIILYRLLIHIERLHERGIEHHDIKMENCIVSPQLQCRLIDFEMSTVQFQVSEHNRGTPIYMPPECFFPTMTKRFGKKDIWSFGILYCILIVEWYPILENRFSEYRQPFFRKLPSCIRQCLHFQPSRRIDSKHLLLQYRSFIESRMKRVNHILHKSSRVMQRETSRE